MSVTWNSILSAMRTTTTTTVQLAQLFVAQVHEMLYAMISKCMRFVCRIFPIEKIKCKFGTIRRAHTKLKNKRESLAWHDQNSHTCAFLSLPGTEPLPVPKYVCVFVAAAAVASFSRL